MFARGTIVIPFLKGGIRRRLLLWNVSLFGLVLSAIILASYIYNVRQIDRYNSELQAEVAALTANEIDAFANRKKERLSDAGLSISLHPIGSKAQQLLATLLLKSDSALTEISILDADGMEVVKVSARELYTASEFNNQRDADKFRNTIRGETYFSQVYTSDKAEPYVTLAAPLKSPSREIIGVITAEVNLRFLWKNIGDIRFGTAGYAYLVDGQGNLIAHKDPSMVLRKTNLRHVGKVQEFLQSSSAKDPRPARKGSGILGASVLSTYAPLKGLGWAVVLEEPLETALLEVKRTERNSWLLLALGLFVATAVMAWFSKKITGPIRELHRGAEIIGSGNLDYRVEITTRDEIELLADEFNRMAKSSRYPTRPLSSASRIGPRNSCALRRNHHRQSIIGSGDRVARSDQEDHGNF